MTKTKAAPPETAAAEALPLDLFVMLAVGVVVGEGGRARLHVKLSVEGDQALAERVNAASHRLTPLVDQFRTAVMEALGAVPDGPPVSVLPVGRPARRIGRA